MRYAVLALLLGTAIAVGGCAGDEPRPGDRPAGYEAVPDEQLFEAVRALPRVRSADLSYTDQLGESNTYRAAVELEPGLRRREVAAVFDQVVEVLRHGRWEADTLVSVVSGDVVEQGSSRDLRTADDYDRAYGPQTGRDDWPPAFVG